MTAKFDTDQIQGTHSNLKDLEQQFNNFSSTISNEIYNAINEIDRIIERLQHCISKIDSKHNQLMQTMHDLSSRLKALEDANRIHESKVNFIKNEISKLETQIDNLQKQLNKEYNILANCRPAYTKIIYYEDGTSAEVLVDPDGAKRQAAQSNIDSLKRQIDQIEHIIDQLSFELNILLNKIDTNNDYMRIVLAQQKHNEDIIENLKTLKLNNEAYITIFASGKSELSQCSSDINYIADRCIESIRYSIKCIQNTFDAAYNYTTLFSRTSSRGFASLDALEKNLKKYKAIMDEHTKQDTRFKLNIFENTAWSDDIRKEIDINVVERLVVNQLMIDELLHLSIKNQKAIRSIKAYLSSR